MQPNKPIKHTKSSLNQELRMMANSQGLRRPQQPNRYQAPSGIKRPRGFPVHNTFGKQPMIPGNQARGTHSITNPLQRSANYRSFQNSNIKLSNNAPSMNNIRSPNQLGASRSFAQGLYSGKNPSINHSNVISVGLTRTPSDRARRCRSGRRGRSGTR